MLDGKKVTVMGLGLLGRGVGDAAYLAEQGADVLVTDLKSREELSESIEKLQEFSNIEYVLGEHRLSDFEDRDFILKGNGVPLNNTYIEHAQKNGVEVLMSGALFHVLSNIPMIGVTGTRGKTTVTELIHHALKRSILGGNIRGVSNLQLLKEVENNDVAVFELDSWQLQGFGYQKTSPHIAVFTNFMEDHLNYYPDMDTYFIDKAQIFLHQKSNDVLIIGEDVEDRVKEYTSRYVVAKEGVVPTSWHPSLVGAHNARNVSCAYHALKAYGLSDEEIRESFESFKGIPGRLECFGEVGGVKVFNDNNATTPTATAAGIEALKGSGKIIAIIGGADKGLDVAPLVEALKGVDHVVLLAGTGTESLDREENVHESLSSAVEEAFSVAGEGDTILFSPGFASFGMFVNEYERNDQFVSLIKGFKV